MSNGNYQETHERILKSGLAAFLEEGFEKANLRRICKAAGVTTGRSTSISKTRRRSSRSWSSRWRA